MSGPPTVRTTEPHGVAALRTAPTQRRHPARPDSDGYETPQTRRRGEGPPLVLVHGSVSDQLTTRSSILVK